MEYKSTKIDDFTWEVLKQVKKLTGVPISRIIKDCVKREYPNMYKKEK